MKSKLKSLALAGVLASLALAACSGESNKEYIVPQYEDTFRLFNNNDKEEYAEFKIFGALGAAKFKKFEVKTFVLENGGIKEKELWF